MLQKIKEDADGFVPLQLLCSFSNMRSLLHLPDHKSSATAQPLTPESLASVVAALAPSTTLTVSEDGTKVKRKTNLPDFEAVQKEIDERSLFVAPFPYDATLTDITACLAAHGKVNCVRMRRHPGSKAYRGNVLVEFDTKVTADAVAQKHITHAGATLRCTPKLTWIDGEQLEEAAREAARPPTPPESSGKAGAKRGRDESRPSGGNKREKKTKPAEPIPDLPAGSVLTMTFPSGSAPDIMRSVLSEALGGRDAVAFIEHSTGEEAGLVRFRTAEVAAGALAGGSVTLQTQDGEQVVGTLGLLEGEAFTLYNEKVKSIMQAKNDRDAASGGRGDRRGRGGGGRGRGRGGRGRGRR